MASKTISKSQSQKGHKNEKPCPVCNTMMEIVILYNPKRHVVWKCQECSTYFKLREV